MNTDNVSVEVEFESVGLGTGTDNFSVEVEFTPGGLKDYTDNLDTEIIVLEGQGVTSYEDLEDLPSIEGVPLIGDNTFSALTLTRITNSEIEDLINN